MLSILGIAILAILVVIALELYLVVIGLSRLPAILSSAVAATKDDKKDSPTINVNVGTVPAAEPIQPRAEPEAAPQPAPIPPPSGALSEPEPQPEEAAPSLPPRPRPKVQATTSGLISIKCPACQAENSSYRAECFNCGKKL
jgi:Sec-independent protein translocase protein TatA